MGCGPITHTARVFLSRNRLYPGVVSRALVKARTRKIWNARRRLQLQGRLRKHYEIKGGDKFNEAYLEYHPGSGNTLLKVKRRAFWYREHGNGLADLIIFGRQLPETVCLGVPADRYRLIDLVADIDRAFFSPANPLVRRIRNGTRSGRKVLIVTLVPAWSQENWKYSDGRDGWYE